MDKLKRFKKYSLRERAEKLPYAGEYFQPDDSCYLPHEVDPYVAALEKRCAELREERDTIYSDMNRIVPEQDRRIAELEAEIDSVKGCHNGKVAAQELVAEMGSYWGVELNRRIEVERQRDCLADELDALAAELIERGKRMVCNCKLQNEIEGYYEVESQTQEEPNG